MTSERRPDGASAGADGWELLGEPDPSVLTHARKAALHAAQPLAAAADALLPPLPEHGHTCLGWSVERRVFEGPELAPGLRGFLDVARLRTGLADARGAELDVLPLAGRTLAGACSSLADLLRARGVALADGPLAAPGYELPDSALAEGATFPAPDTAFAELARWCHDGFLALDQLSAELLGGAPVLLWPQRFEQAARRGPDASGRALALGLSPGDGAWREPYFHATPEPRPAPEGLPELARFPWGGPRWYTRRFTGAVLIADEVVAAERAEEQRGRVLEALRAAVEACERLPAS